MQDGWVMTIETTNGVVGLWTCWLGNNLKLFYPIGTNISDEIIMETLNVTLAEPVKNVLFGRRLWAKYYSKRLNDGGRVWINQEWTNMTGEKLYTIESRQLKGHYCGSRSTNIVSTIGGHFCSKAEPDAPNCKKENIQEYKDKFMQLLVKIAKSVGEITAINLDSGLVLYTPEMLKEKGYNIERWKRDSYNEYCYTRDGDIEIMLKKGNSLVSWNTIIRLPATNELTAEELIAFVNSFNNAENSLNPIPLLNYLVRQSS